MAEQEYLTVAEVAERLRVSQKFVRDEIKRKRLRALEIGKGYRILIGDFEAYNILKQTRESNNLVEV